MNWSRSAGDSEASTDAQHVAGTAPASNTVRWLPMDQMEDSH
ncbi:hypothetical protein OG604_39565 [Streptomyces sp. NBC_01231]|nr:hypothetical protein OG604_39565 [Streptomyces sp. NBC_01231]